jgi:hypothetical protein
LTWDMAGGELMWMRWWTFGFLRYVVIADMPFRFHSQLDQMCVSMTWLLYQSH